MNRRVLWVQVLIGWLPIWGLFTALIILMHGGHAAHAGLISLRMIVAAAGLAILVHKFTERFRWPARITLAFVLTHFALAFVFSFTWVALNSAIESAIRGIVVIVIPYGMPSMIMLGVWLYVMIAGVSYSVQSTERAARAEATAVKAQLAALRSQLNPHFLFNALHTVVHLIPREPKRAASAAEGLATLLRGTIDADHDTVSLSDELAFVDKYLDIERIRFEDRLRVHVDAPDDARSATVPSFSVQTLVENAVRHGATPREAPTDIRVTARIAGRNLVVIVADNGGGGTPSGNGTGLKRLRERLAVLYNGSATLAAEPQAGGGFSATLTIPVERAD
jgi:sensor histidine kinase YesM